MDNDKENQKKLNQNENGLQGDSSIDESKDQEQKTEMQPDDIEGNEMNHWVREISDGPDFQDEDIVESLENVPVSKGDLPEWINELSPVNPEIFDSEEEINESQDQQDPLQVESVDESWETEQDNELVEVNDQDANDGTHDNLDEGFVEISELDLSADNKPKTESSIPEDKLEDQEELPDWLEDMITEQPEPSGEEDEKIQEERIFMNDEPTKPVPIIEDSTSIDNDEQEIHEEFVTPNLTLDEIEITDSQSQIEETIHVVDFEKETPVEEIETDQDLAHGSDREKLELYYEEVSPAPVEESQDEEVLVSGEEDWESQSQASLEFPKTLRFAKYLLDQSEIEPAYKIFKTYINKSDHLEVIKAWITDAINEENLSESSLWELLGDITTKKNEYGEALSAYTKSISILLNDQ